MKAKLMVLLVILAAAWLLPLGAQEPGYRVIKVLNEGWIKGKVTHTRTDLDVPKLETDRDVKACGPGPKPIEAVNIGPDGALRNVVVYLKDITAGKEFLMPPKPPVLNQNHCSFEPHVQVVPVNSSFKITNNDNTLHGVHAFWFPLGTKFVLYPNSITYPAKTVFNIAMVATRKESFQQIGGAGIVKFICEAGHFWMTAYAVVLPHPYFAKVNDDGTYLIENVPPGKYTLVSWQEYFGTQEKAVEVKANQPAMVDFTYSEEL